jgi:hypothetical protein
MGPVRIPPGAPENEAKKPPITGLVRGLFWQNGTNLALISKTKMQSFKKLESNMNMSYLDLLKKELRSWSAASGTII